MRCGSEALLHHIKVKGSSEMGNYCGGGLMKNKESEICYAIDEYKESERNKVTDIGTLEGVSFVDFVRIMAQQASSMRSLNFLTGETCQNWCKRSLKDVGMTLPVMTGTEVATATVGSIAFGIAAGLLALWLNSGDDDDGDKKGKR